MVGQYPGVYGGALITSQLCVTVSGSSHPHLLKHPKRDVLPVRGHHGINNLVVYGIPHSRDKVNEHLLAGNDHPNTMIIIDD